jgi:hypothetical protein
LKIPPFIFFASTTRSDDGKIEASKTTFELLKVLMRKSYCKEDWLTLSLVVL